MADYQSKYTGPEIDNAVGKANNLFNGVTPLDAAYGGTGVTSIEALKSLLGTGGGGGGITGVVPVSKGGTGATSAAKARTNLGITPANIGALGKDGDQQINGGLKMVRPDYASVRLQNTTPGFESNFSLYRHQLQLSVYNAISDTTTYRLLQLADSTKEPEFGRALKLTDRTPGASDKTAYIITTANLRNEMQNAFKGGASVVKSVQRGTKEITKDNITVDIAISAVNPDKAVVNMSAEYYVGGSTSHITPSIRLESGENGGAQIKIHVPNNTGAVTAYWQVIEFY